MIVNDYEENYITGYISVYRSVLNNPFWVSEKFTRGQAWIDLLLLAKYKDGFFYKREIKVNYKRGEVTEGIINLSKRWSWSRNKTQKFINDLEKEQQIRQQKSNVITLLSIVNYDLYQKKDTKRYNSRTPSDTTAGQQQDTHNKDNNINKENKEIKEDKKMIFFSWLEYRKEIKKPIKAKSTIQGLIKKFNAEDLNKCKWVVNNSIENNYQGLFWDNYKAKKQTNKPDRPVF